MNALRDDTRERCQAIVDFVSEKGCCTFADLRSKFQDAFSSDKAMRSALAYLTYHKRLSREGVSRSSCWKPGKDAPPSAELRVPPPRINVYAAPVYTPTPDTSTRLGALNFKSIHSRGVSC